MKEKQEIEPDADVQFGPQSISFRGDANDVGLRKSLLVAGVVGVIGHPIGYPHYDLTPTPTLPM